MSREPLTRNQRWEMLACVPVAITGAAMASWMTFFAPGISVVVWSLGALTSIVGFALALRHVYVAPEPEPEPEFCTVADFYNRFEDRSYECGATMPCAKHAKKS